MLSSSGYIYSNWNRKQQRHYLNPLSIMAVMSDIRRCLLQREQMIEHALHALEKKGLAAITSLGMMEEQTEIPLSQWRYFWSDRDTLLYDTLYFHCQQIDTWREQVVHDSLLSHEQKLLARYDILRSSFNRGRFPGCLLIAACSFYPQPGHPVHQLAEQQKQASWQYSHDLLVQLGSDNPALVTDQMELILEGCLSKLLIKRDINIIETAHTLAGDVLHLAMCRREGALT